MHMKILVRVCAGTGYAWSMCRCALLKGHTFEPALAVADALVRPLLRHTCPAEQGTISVHLPQAIHMLCWPLTRWLPSWCRRQLSFETASSSASALGAGDS